VRGLLGPDQTCARSGLDQLSATQFRDALQDVQQFVETEHRIPSRVFIGAEAVSPADFLYALAFAHNKPGAATGSIPLGRELALLSERYVAKDTPDLFGGWIIHKEGFRAPKILEIARLQTWTLKPALLKSSGRNP